MTDKMKIPLLSPPPIGETVLQCPPHGDMIKELETIKEMTKEHCDECGGPDKPPFDPWARDFDWEGPGLCKNFEADGQCKCHAGKEAVHYFCSRDECWQSKAMRTKLGEMFPLLAYALQYLCINREHRMEPAAHTCVDCGMSRDHMRSMESHSPVKIKTRWLWEEAPLIWTLPKDVDDEIREEMSDFYFELLKKHDMEVDPGTRMPGTEDWDYYGDIP